MTTIAAHTTWMTGRQLRAIARQPAYLVIMLIQPVIWLFLFGSLFRKVVELPGFGTASYLDYLVPGVREPRIEGTSLSVRADEGATALPAVLAALEGAGVSVRAATVARPSLDDVYVRYAGRRFTEADQSPATLVTPGGSK